MQAPLFIVWRESFEALLIIGILYSWMRRENYNTYLYLLWIGTGIGLFLSSILAICFYFAGQWFSGPGGEWFAISMALVAALLILQMVSWMHSHGKNMKKELENTAQKYLQKSDKYGIIILTALAVAREGSETIIFLAGVGAQQTDTSTSTFVLGAVLGLILALLTFWFLQKFTNIFSWKWFFFVSEAALLLIGCGLFMTACDKIAAQLSDYDLPEWAYDFIDMPLWDSSWLLSDSSTLTGLTGYHAMPSLLQLSVFITFWLCAFLLLRIHSNTKKIAVKK